MKPNKEVGLQDRFGTPITLGCVVENLVAIPPFHSKGHRFRCIFNIPQHRYGFERVVSTNMGSKDYDDNFLSLRSNSRFYATPKNAKNIKVVNV